MRKIISFITLILLMSACNSQRKKTLIGAIEYQQKLNESYKDGSKSPLKKNDLKNFKGLEFYPVDSSFIVTARLTKTKDATTFEMATTTDRKPLYKEYGILTFTLKGIDCSLTVYQSQDDLRDDFLESNNFRFFSNVTEPLLVVLEHFLELHKLGLQFIFVLRPLLVRHRCIRRLLVASFSSVEPFGQALLSS